jgi:hypothetical protein
MMFEIAKRILDPASIAKPNKLFGMATRMNQDTWLLAPWTMFPERNPLQMVKP